MSVRRDLAEMTIRELRVYVLNHRSDEEALHLYLDRLQAENSGSRFHTPEEEVGAAISEYLNQRKA